MTLFRTFLFAGVLLLTAGVYAVETHQDFDNYRVQFSVVNSTFIPPEVAQAHDLTRARDQALINLSITHTGGDEPRYGVPAQVSGQATNLMQQSRKLDFIEVREAEVVYYLAPLRHTNEEVMRFHLQVQPEGETQPLEMRFERTLHRGD